jgi:hypothetical protein
MQGVVDLVLFARRRSNPLEGPAAGEGANKREADGLRGDRCQPAKKPIDL